LRLVEPKKITQNDTNKIKIKDLSLLCVGYRTYSQSPPPIVSNE
jgi:hypothetical protein